MLAHVVKMAAPDIGPQRRRQARQVVQRDGDGDAIGVAATRISSSDAAILIASRMICHGAASRCITSDSAKGSNCGVCRVGTLSAAPTEAICGSPNIRRKLGSRR